MNKKKKYTVIAIIVLLSLTIFIRIVSNKDEDKISVGLLSDLILKNNGGAKDIEAKIADFNKTALSVDAYDNYSDWCTKSSYCNIDKATKEENGMYAIEDNEGTSYYFRGAVDNNWVVFGQEDGKPIYWRIVRIEGNGNIKLIYSGTTAPTEFDAVTMIGDNTQLSELSSFQDGEVLLDRDAYLFLSMEGVGYVYEDNDQHGIATDSLIKNVIDTWYANTLEPSYGSYISNQTVCIDRIGYTRTGEDWEYEFTKINSLEEASGAIYNGSYKRLYKVADAVPSLGCEMANDALIINTGLITADEVSLAGGVSYMYNTSYYLYTDNTYWTISPYSSSSNANVFTVFAEGYLKNNYVVDAYGVRPTVSLNASTLVSSGNGTWENPYIVF